MGLHSANRDRRWTRPPFLALVAVLLLAAGLVASSSSTRSAAAADPVTVTFAVADGYDSKSAKTLVNDGKLYVVDRSDNDRFNTEAGQSLVMRFAGSVPAGATILGVDVLIERYEESGITPAAVRWQVGGGTITNPTVAATTTPAPRSSENAEGTDTWEVGAAIDTPAEVSGLTLAVRNTAPASNGKKALVDRVVVVVRYVEGTATPTPTPTATPTPTPTPAPAPATATVFTAGDVADCGSSGDEQTANLLDANPGGTILGLGDLAYESGTASDFANCYNPTWGRHKARARPAPGNHEYQTSGATGYYGYFGAAAGPGNRGYYSFDLGSWHIVSLNSEVGFGATSAQLTWLRQDLAANTAACTLAFFHKPRFTAGNYSDFTTMKPFWDALYADDAEIALGGHDHVYERYRPMNPAGTADAARGIRQFVVGTGGRGHYALRTDARREAGSTGALGVLQLTLKPTSYDWRFLPVAGALYTDSGTTSCH